MSEPTSQFLDSFKDKLPKATSVIISGAFFFGSFLIQYGGKTQHITDVQVQQEKRLTDLESQVRNDLATRREVDDVKKAVDRIEQKLDDEISYHRHGSK